MSRLLRADSTSSSQTAATAWAVHQRAETQVGDLVVVVFAYGSSGTPPAAPDGTWTAVTVATQGAAAYLAAFHKTAATAGAADYTFTGPGARPYIGWCGVVAGSAPAATTTGATSATASAAAATPTTAGSLVVAAFMTARLGIAVPSTTNTVWARRCAGLSGSNGAGVSAYLGVYALDNAPASAVPSLAVALPSSAIWVAETLVFAPNAQPAAALLSDTWSPRAGVWAPIPESTAASGVWA